MKHLSSEEINKFILDGFFKIEEAFPIEIADECRNILWKATGCDPENPATWTQPVVRIGELDHEALRKAANTPVLHRAFDQLAGHGNWLPRQTMGSFPIRFPGKFPAGDTGWHVDASFPGADPTNYLEWRINVHSRGRSLLMLFLFSDVSEQDAPTRIKIGSHLDVARILEPEGEEGLSFMQLAQKLEFLPRHDEALATGSAGTVYLCHPFLVHAAQDHHGNRPKFMAQPPLLTKTDFNIYHSHNELSPVEQAICLGIAR
ncbi:MAG TPA: hypothetical protein VLC28_04680 [Flavitalea sp.]|nr:hypothetical protein [Flavitalea sp.]